MSERRIRRGGGPQSVIYTHGQYFIYLRLCAGDDPDAGAQCVWNHDYREYQHPRRCFVATGSSGGSAFFADAHFTDPAMIIPVFQE